MRLAAQAKAGYYPAHYDAVCMALRMLSLPEGKPVALLDPCAGEGLAIFQFAANFCEASEFGDKASKIAAYAIELEEGRGKLCEEKLYQFATTEWQTEHSVAILQPCSFQGAAISPNSFSFAWVNPPFDDMIGGGARVEYMFLQRATQLLRPKGIMMLVLPETAIRNDLPLYFIQNYEEISVTPFPESCRPFNEIIIAGVKRQQPTDEYDGSWWNFVQEYSGKPTHYTLPPALGPKRWEKCDFTPDELLKALATSPLNTLLEPPPEIPLAEPPLPLANGHIALQLASGMLDGVVQYKQEPPHVVRGTARKVEYVQEETEEEKPDGSVVSRTILSEKIVLGIRAASQDGTIVTFGESEGSVPDGNP